MNDLKTDIEQKLEFLESIFPIFSNTNDSQK